MKRMSHDDAIRLWEERKSQTLADKNQRFLDKLFYGLAPYDVDQYKDDLGKIIDRLYQQAFEIIDCTKCARCCFLDINWTEEDAKRIAEYLNVSNIEFVNSKPCQFLDSTNRCTIYEVRPEVCRKFPSDDPWISQTYAERIHTCPAVFLLLEGMKREVRKLLKR